jgi:H+/Cl- antiporter ClcA
MAMLALGSVMVSGLVSLGIAGDYVYFGSVHAMLSGGAAFAICPLAGIVGGAMGGVFARALLGLGSSRFRPLVWARRHPVLWAAICGLAVAAVGYATNGATWGTGYAAAKSVIADGAELPWHFGLDKLFVTLASSASGAPGGIFAPSLSAGAGFGALLARLFPSEPVGAIATLGMIGYFVGVVRSPLTAVLIVSEMTDTRAMLIPLVATAIIADAASALVCEERLYHGLSKAFRVPETHRRTAEQAALSSHANIPRRDLTRLERDDSTFT